MFAEWISNEELWDWMGSPQEETVRGKEWLLGSICRYIKLVKEGQWKVTLNESSIRQEDSSAHSCSKLKWSAIKKVRNEQTV